MSVFRKDGLIKVVPIITEDDPQSKLKHEVDQDEIDFCLNCTKETCKYGNCDDYKQFMKKKRAAL